MAINTIHIQNFKSIRNIEIDLRKINILIGANGSGKTNFITFFKFLRKIYEQNLHIYTAECGGVDKLLYYGLKHSEFLYGKITFDNEWKNEYEFKLKPTASNVFYFEFEKSNYFRPGASKINTKVINAGGPIESMLQYSDGYRDRYLKNFLESFRIFHFHDTSFTSKLKTPSLLSDTAFLHEDGSNLAAILYYIKEKHPEKYSEIIFTVRSNIPYFDDFYLEPDKFNSQYIELRWKVKNKDNIFNAHQLSDGSLRFIALTTLLMQPTLPASIIIDEPELGLHPYAINQLAQMIYLASKHSQIIISTQSSDLIDAFIANASDTKEAVESILVTEFEDNQTKLKRLNFEELRDWLDDYSLSELWHKNIIKGRP